MTVAGLTFAGLVYLVSRIYKFRTVKRLIKANKSFKWLVAVLFLIALAACFVIDEVNTAIVILHFVLFWIIGDIIALIIRKAKGRERKNSEKPYFLGIAVIVFTTVYLAVGWYLAHHVWVTKYTFATEKNIGSEPIRVVLFSDSHIGTTFDGEGFAAYMERIQAENPDMVLIAGDYVDDDTTREDMIRSCRALGELKTKYGVFYSDGNHDKGYYQSRDFSYAELLSELEENGVTVLRDDAKLINDSVYVVGRLDKYDSGRMSMEALIEGFNIDKDKYIIVMDHQPNDYAAEAAAKVDIVLSGHTHGGQLIPINRVGELIGANDRTYGLEKRDNTNFVVTSGISCWAIKFKTGTKSEYVVLDIVKQD